ncbi:fused MFS/spermidine synthase [Candidatus Aerophobetes bacterium]|nr:fused MFS/spermidine synthase [Candidatus Aerophobetes bacterium]
MKKRVNLAILTMGFSGLVAQMLLLRELLIVFSGNELSIGIILANWLILEAFGAFFLGKRAETTKRKVETFAIIAIIFSLSLLAAVYSTRILKNILGVSIGEGLGLLPILYSSFLILLPTSVTHGALFTFSCKIYSSFSRADASSVGKVYVYETVGTVVGGIVWTYLLIPYFHAFHMAAGLAVLNFFVCTLLLIPYWRNGRFQKTVTTVCFLFLFLGIFSIFAGGADRLHSSSIKTQWKNQNVVHYQNSIYGNICVIESGGQYTFFSDGIVHTITPIPDIVFVEEFVHLAFLSHPHPESVLIVSGGAGGIINEVLKHPSVELVEYAELDPLILELLRKFPTPLTEDELTDNRVTIKHIDGRLFLKMTENQYDIVLVGLSEPSDLQTNRFFTKEFFSLVEKRLTETGILVIGLPGSLAYLSDELKNLNACILNTLHVVFPYVRVIPGDGTNIFLASHSDEVSLIDKMRLAQRLEERNLRANLLIPRHIEYKLHPQWVDWFLQFVEGGTQKINHDFKPLGLFYSISYWNAIYTPYLSTPFRWLEKINVWMFVAFFLLFVGLFLLVRRKKPGFLPSGVPFCVGTSGFAGMMFELTLIFTFQAIYGYAFGWIGLLVASFMAGAACGAMKITSMLPGIQRDGRFFIHIELAIICFSLLLAFVFFLLRPYLDSPTIFFFLRILFLCFSFISGLLIGSQFPLANKIYLKGKASFSKTAGLLYSSDLVGGWLGGVVGGVVLLPVLGLFGACMVVFLLKLSSFIIITWQVGKVR